MLNWELGMLRVAVCFSGLTRDVSELVSYNKTLLDNYGFEIKFDYFCQFFSKDNNFL